MPLSVVLTNVNPGTDDMYCIAEKFDGELNLMVWRSGLKLPN